MSWDKLTKDEQGRVRDMASDLADAGVTTTVSQVAAHYSSVSAWAADRLRLATLCRRAGWGLDGIKPVAIQDGEATWVHMPAATFHAAKQAAKTAPTNPPGDHGDHITLAVRLKTTGELKANNYPVVTTHHRTRRPQRLILTGRSKTVEGDEAMVWAETPVNKPPTARGLSCAECATYGARIARLDCLRRFGFVCGDCEAAAHFTARPFAAS